MANVKISQLPTATTLTTADLLPIVQGGVTKQVTPDLLPVSTATAAALAGKDAAGAATAAQAAAIAAAATAAATASKSADTITDGTTNKAYTATEKTKLAGVATSATANRADSATDALLAAKADLVGGLVPSSQIPAIALTNAVTVASQAAMLALTTTQVQPGDVAVRTDGAGTFILTATDPTQLANWVRLNAPTDAVTTVNGQSGTVVLTAANVGADAAGAAAAITPTSLGLGNVNNTSDVNKPVSAATSTAIGNSTINQPVNVMSANGTAVIGARNAVNASAGPVAVTLPAPTAVGQHIIIERSDASAVAANAITITGTIRGTANTVVTLAAVGAANEGGHYIAESLTSWAIAGSIKPKAVLDKYYDALGAAAAVTYPSLNAKPGPTAHIGTRRVIRLGLFPDSSNAASETQYATAAGEQPTLILTPYSYLDQPDTVRLNALHVRGQTPVIAWMPRGTTDVPTQPTYTLANIIAGNFDAYMTTFLTTLKNLNFTVYMRWAHEMNGNWYPWSEQTNGNSAGQFAAAWQHVYNLAQTVGATNVKWIFCPSTDYGTPGQPGGSTLISALYPGDAYVDILGMNGYNYGAAGPSGWRTPATVYGATYADLIAVNSTKPVWICEMGCANDDGGSKATWFGQFATWLLSTRISEFLYFNASDPGGYNWYVDSTPANAAAFASAIATIRESSQASGYQLVAGANTTITTDTLNRTVTIAATGGSGGVTAAKASGLALVLGS